MKVKFKLTYKNGKEETYIQESTKQEFSSVMKVIDTCFQYGSPGSLTINKDDKHCTYIRLDELSRVSTTVME